MSMAMPWAARRALIQRSAFILFVMASRPPECTAKRCIDVPSFAQSSSVNRSHRNTSLSGSQAHLARIGRHGATHLQVLRLRDGSLRYSPAVFRINWRCKTYDGLGSDLWFG